MANSSPSEKFFSFSLSNKWFRSDISNSNMKSQSMIFF